MKKLFPLLILLVFAGCAYRMPKLIILDVNPSGQISLEQRVVSETEMDEALRHRYESQGACPVVVRADYETSHNFIRELMDLCIRCGHWEFVLSLPAATPENLQPWLSEDMATRRNQFRLHSPPELRDGKESPTPPGFHILITKKGFVVENQEIQKDDLSTQLVVFAKQADTKTKEIFITCLSDSNHGDLVWLLEICGKFGLEHVWLISM